MKEIKCPNCGAPINRATMRCEYCGAAFENEFGYGNQMIIHRIEHPKAVPLKSVMQIDRDLASIDGYEKYVVDSISRSLAEKVAEYMDLTFQDDPMNDRVTAYARIRIVPPGVRFL